MLNKLSLILLSLLTLINLCLVIQNNNVYQTNRLDSEKRSKYSDYDGINSKQKLFNYVNKMYTEKGIKVTENEGNSISINIDTDILDKKYFDSINNFPKMNKHEIETLSYNSDSDISIWIDGNLSYDVSRGHLTHFTFGRFISWT
ncbi:hypothetical protein [Leuconostoc mesenteroides]|uniref:hypothetical protein n=1 Tax=Leuconostoc mesenteroides TaxID=1245 RepID=UPI00235EE441|nr:hypothetical protein [Leuconostoc mesenteroides]